MNKRTKAASIAAGAVLLVLIVAPVISANIWKSDTLSTANTTADLINKAAEATNKFNSKANAVAADYDSLVATYKKQQAALKEAKQKAQDVGGFKGLDLGGAYKKASGTSDELVKIYDEMLSFYSAQIASAEAEKQIIAAFEQTGTATDASTMTAQAQAIRTANAKYQDYLKSGTATALESKTSALLTKFSDALDFASQAVTSKSISKLNQADAQLQSVITEFDSLQAEQDTQFAADQKKLQSIVDRLNKTTKELE